MTQNILAGVNKIEITRDADETFDASLPEQAKKHIPVELLNTRLQVDDPLYARVLILDDGTEKIVLITMDVTAISARTISQNILYDSADDFMPNLREQIQNKFNIPGERVSVSASHTHQAPRMLCDDAAQIDKILEAVGRALRNMIPVQIGVGSGYENSITTNRTIMLKNGKDHTLSPFPGEDEVEKIRPVDPEIGILRIDKLDGTPFAVVYNFGCHLLLGSPLGNYGHITADHVGVTLKYLEDGIGGDVMAFFLQGAGGDVWETFNYDLDKRNRTVDFGTTLGKSVMKGYEKIATKTAQVKFARKVIAFPFRTDIPDIITTIKQEQATLLASLNTAYAPLFSFKEFLPVYLRYSLNPEYPSQISARYLKAATCDDKSIEEEDERNRLEIKKYLDRIRIMENLTRNELKISMLQKHAEVIREIGSSKIDAEILGIKIGDCVYITAPMEILTEIGLNVKKMSPFKYTFIVSISNGYLHYAAPAAYYSRGGYEVTECILAPEWEEIFYTTVRNIFNELQ